jgi:hypothetical protein
MSLNGESSYWAMAWTGGQGSYSATWSFELAPSVAFAKVWYNFYMEYGGVGMVSPGIISIRRRKPDNSDEVVPTNFAPAVFDPRMTNVTVGLNIYSCQAQMFLDIGFW